MDIGKAIKELKETNMINVENLDMFETFDLISKLEKDGYITKYKEQYLLLVN